MQTKAQEKVANINASASTLSAGANLGKQGLDQLLLASQGKKFVSFKTEMESKINNVDQDTQIKMKELAIKGKEAEFAEEAVRAGILRKTHGHITPIVKWGMEFIKGYPIASQKLRDDFRKAGKKVKRKINIDVKSFK